MFKRWESGEPTSLKGDIARSLAIGMPIHAINAMLLAASLTSWSSPEIVATHTPISIGVCAGASIVAQAVITGTTIALRKDQQKETAEMSR